LVVGDEDPLPVLRVAAAGDARLFLEHLVSVAKEVGC
jgi:hypothetical protein